MQFPTLPWLAALCCAVPAAAQGPALPDPTSFRPLSSFGVADGVAEIVAASSDGNTLVYTNSSAKALGIVDITNPVAPAALVDVVLPNEPTSVDVYGNFALVTVFLDKAVEGAAPPAFLPGRLYVVDISVPAAPVVKGWADIGYHPDSIQVVDVAGNPVAVIAIENEPVVVVGGVVTGDDVPGDPNDVSPAGLIQVVELDLQVPSNSVIHDVALPQATLAGAGLYFTADPQPEFVAVHGTTAAVTLQENNGVAIVDLANPAAPVLTNVFSLGVAASRLADLNDNDAIAFTEAYPDLVGSAYPLPEDAAGNTLPGGLRFADSLAFSPDGSALLTADEGELDYTGGRGWSVWNTAGANLWQDGGQMERIAVRVGQYPDGRSDAKGVEMEGLTTATFGSTDFAFVMSERGSFMAVYDIGNPASPRFVQVLPTGIEPEGVTAIPARGLVVTADEASGTLSLFEAVYGGSPYSVDAPLLYSPSASTPWGALSGFTAAPNGRFLLAVPDNALPTSVFRIDIGGKLARVSDLGPVTIAGAQAYYDGEGIALDSSILAPANAGVWIASEGDASSKPNLLVQVDDSGAVLREIQLPANVDAAADPLLAGNAQAGANGEMIRSNGFEGVTLTTDGRYLLAVIQRDFAGEFASPRYARVARYDLDQLVQVPGLQVGLRCGGDWDFFFLQLDSDDGDNWAGLSEICTLGPDRYAVIERDKGIAVGSQLKRVYEFGLAGLTPDADGIPTAADTVVKTLVADVLDAFFPLEKIECLAPTPQGDLWIGLDNDGGEVEPRVRNLGPVY